jgi:isoamylase
MSGRVGPGRPTPLGATVTPEGINFAVFSRNARTVYLELFDHQDDSRPHATHRLLPETNRIGDVWHLFAFGLGDGQLYGWRVDGPYCPEGEGHRFNVNKLLLDPYAKAIAGAFDLNHPSVYGFDRSSPAGDLSFSTSDSAGRAAKSVALAQGPTDWGWDRPLRRPLGDTVIYEVHVRGFTVHPSSLASHGGTFLGLTEKIPYLLDLGVTAVGLLPVHDFGGGEPVGVDPWTGRPLRNYWGYNTVGFFSPEKRYCASGETGAAVRDFQRMVNELHLAGIEVLLDVVFNHTGEGNERGPTLSFRGLDNSIYYLLDGGRRYKNYSGCGNTVACNHPVVKQFILDCLRYWVVEMHVDGFRFDLATILGRDRRGEWIGDLSLLFDISGDPILRGCKLIAEAWDADGMYKVGAFPRGWAEWNGRFRDDVRRFVRGDRGMVQLFAQRLGGSRDLFGQKEVPEWSINFITAHDGFTLRDLVSYDRKHNERNGESNRDGQDENYSASGGVEGETADPILRTTRRRQAKNLLVALLVARGTPMLLGGDEIYRTQQGNNNTYCQDNELAWFHWALSDSEVAEVHRFAGMLIALRRRARALRRPGFVDPFAVDGAGAAGPVGGDITWHGVKLGRPDWSYHSHSIALHIHGCVTGARTDADTATPEPDYFVLFNAWCEPLDFELPPLPQGHVWRRLVDTSLPSPEEIVSEDEATLVAGQLYQAGDRSAVILVAR